MSSSDREPSPPPTQHKDKGKKRADVPTDGKGKNEGPALHWDYTPPPGVTLLQNDAGDAGEFDWDAVANDKDTEIWLIRVPESIKPRYLEGAVLERKSVKKNVRVGTLARKHATFDVWSLGEKADEEDDNDGADVGGEEIKSLSCLLPRKSKNGNLYPAPRPIARHLVVSAQAAAPTPSVPIHPYTQPPRESYPKEVLTHSFKPYGSLSDARTQDEGGMDVDVRSAPTSSATHAKARRAKVGSPEMDKKKKKGKETETRADAMDVDVSPSRAAPSLPPTLKKAKPANAQATEVKEKTKGKKRKGDGVEEKKSKKVKT